MCRLIVLAAFAALSATAASGVASESLYGTGEGTCGNTDREVYDICDVKDGICHSFCVKPEDPDSQFCDFRGSFIGDMVTFHDQAIAEEENCENMQATKLYRLSTPEFAGLPRECDEDAMNTEAVEFLLSGGNRKHVSFELYATHWCDADGNCQVILPPDLIMSDCEPNGTVATVVDGMSMGADKYSVRDQIMYREPPNFNNGVRQLLMYQLFGRDVSINKIGFGRAEDPDTACIAAGCEEKSFAAGQWKFTAVTGLDATPEDITKIRLEIHVILEGGDEATDSIEELEEGLWRFNATTDAGDEASFTLSLDSEYFYAAVDFYDIFDDGIGEDPAVGHVSFAYDEENEPMVMTVFIDLELDYDFKALCESQACTLMYDPTICVGGGRCGHGGGGSEESDDGDPVFSEGNTGRVAAPTIAALSAILTARAL